MKELQCVDYSTSPLCIDVTVSGMTEKMPEMRRTLTSKEVVTTLTSKCRT